MNSTEVVVALVIAVGLVGILIPVLPGSILVLAGILVWALEIGSGTAWTVFAVAATLLAIGAALKYVVPQRRLKDAGVPNSTQWYGAAGAIVGFFVVPVLGIFLGFVAGIYLAERRRVGATLAWPSTKSALRAAGLSILIELATGMLAAATWVVGVLVT